MVLCSPLLPCTSTPDAPPTKGAAWGCHMPQKGCLPKKGVEGGGSPPHACIRGATLARRNETSALKAGTRARTQPGPPTARRRPFVWSSAKYCPWPLSCQLPSLAKPLQLTHPAGFGGRGGGLGGHSSADSQWVCGGQKRTTHGILPFREIANHQLRLHPNPPPEQLAATNSASTRKPTSNVADRASAEEETNLTCRQNEGLALKPTW